MHKILVFDLDGTLAKIGKPILHDDILKLIELQKKGYRIAICSGKPTYYLCGMFRQAGLEDAIFIGENGATVQYGVELPPKKFLVHEHSHKAKRQLAGIRKKIEDDCGFIWFQPNEVAVTPFPSVDGDFEVIQNIIDESRDELTELFVYPQCDCFDITPKNISKAGGLEMLVREEGLTKADLIAVGDGINDIPMFEYADISIAIGDRVDFPADFRFNIISDALDFIARESL